MNVKNRPDVYFEKLSGVENWNFDYCLYGNTSCSAL